MTEGSQHHGSNRMADVQSILKRNLDEVEERIVAACGRVGRRRDQITLVAITKYVNADTARALCQLGVTNLGESRPQELWKKAEAVPEARWHLVGHLQRNKVEQTLHATQFIHSIDSLRLLEALDLEATNQGRRIEALIEFNLSGDVTKHGFVKEQLGFALQAMQSLRSVVVRGLMTMAGWGTDNETARPVFKTLRELRDAMRQLVPPGHTVDDLSMGMTGDFEAAIEEGATLVRIGSALFRGLEAT
jgi:hypothetical protein